MSYDESYARVPEFFGAEPDELLVEHGALIGIDLPVLDVGAGQGRNALYVARLGHAVDALQPSATGARQIAETARATGLPVRVLQQGFEDFLHPAHAYGAVLAFGVIPDLTREQVGTFLDRARGWTARGGLLFLTGFTTEDPSLAHWREQNQVGAVSFVDGTGRIRTFLEPGEVLRLTRGFTPVFHREGLGPEHRHGDGPPERHGRFEVVLRLR
jgi:2-polyprenyl-3-methyl-5-hydroxy-6-metoxy-1,4-benzoquinol methylase